MIRLASTLSVALLAASTLSACAGSAPGSAGTTTGAAGTGSATRTMAATTTELPTGRGGSAHVRSSWVVDGATLSLEYGRPALKGRPESQMMPAGKPWRTGADAATILTTDRALTFGTVTLQPGTYTINTVPGPDQWQIVFGRLKAPGQWGVPYQPDLEIGRAPMRLSAAATPAELVTFHLDYTATGPALRMEWGTVSASAPFTVVR
ncbi:MAG: hypothetical protein JWL60_542 [Gemmatimonadetes bacterium]|jgi:hypothetical protein|nr:hypothetical protein [Gemmatimonadota bacterium]